DAGSPAASLDYAISKEPNWFMDMFGVDESGKCRAKTLFRRQNSERKQPGPVRVWLDPTVLSGTEIAVFRNESRVSKLSTISSFAMLIEAEWYASTRNSSRKLYSHSKRHGSSDLIIK